MFLQKQKCPRGRRDDDVDGLGNAIQEYNKKFKLIWPSHNIYPYQKINFFGANMYTFPYFQFNDHK